MGTTICACHIPYVRRPALSSIAVNAPGALHPGSLKRSKQVGQSVSRSSTHFCADPGLIQGAALHHQRLEKIAAPAVLHDLGQYRILCLVSGKELWQG